LVAGRVQLQGEASCGLYRGTAAWPHLGVVCPGQAIPAWIFGGGRLLSSPLTITHSPTKALVDVHPDHHALFNRHSCNRFVAAQGVCASYVCCLQLLAVAAHFQVIVPICPCARAAQHVDTMTAWKGTIRVKPALLSSPPTASPRGSSFAAVSPQHAEPPLNSEVLHLGPALSDPSATQHQSSEANGVSATDGEGDRKARPCAVATAQSCGEAGQAVGGMLCYDVACEQQQ